jgi:hypothetical protein
LTAGRTLLIRSSEAANRAHLHVVEHMSELFVSEAVDVTTVLSAPPALP